eukprot:5326007-Amphidinium_carterae.2
MHPQVFPRQSLCASHFRWRVCLSFKLGGQHINALELRAAHAGIKFFLRSAEHLGSRCLLALDSQVCLGVLVKGRSSSRVLNHVLRLTIVQLHDSLGASGHGLHLRGHEPESS